MLHRQFNFIIFITLLSSFSFLNLEAQETVVAPAAKAATAPSLTTVPTPSNTDAATTKARSEFKKSFQLLDKVLFERRNESMFEILTGPFSFHEYDDQLKSASELGIGFYNFTDTGRYGSGMNVIFGNSTVQNTSGAKLDGQYFAISQQFLKRMQICPSFFLLAHLGLGFLSGEVSNVMPDKSYLRFLTDQKLSLMFRILGGKEDDGSINPTSSGLYLNVGIKNMYVFNEPTVVDAGFGSNMGWFINLAFMSTNWLPVGTN